ncbi:MAG: class I SAM-dependent methyltransferase [Magnetococcales bacterium]|nr:class I SAM-dependent methyltransferase [Magnetococcales bacterium]
MYHSIIKTCNYYLEGLRAVHRRHDLERLVTRWQAATQGSQQMKWVEMLELTRLILDSQPEVVVEIGCFNGVTSRILGEAIRHVNPLGRLYCIDPFETRHQQSYAGDRYQADTIGYDYETIFDANTQPLGQGIIKLKGWSATVPLPEGLAPQLVFVDGDHSREGVMLDIQRFVPMLPEGGMIGFHDFTIGRKGVITALAETLWPAPNAQFFSIVSHIESLLVIRKKGQPR